MTDDGKTLYVTGAGVSADSGIPTFRGEDGYWTIGSANYTPQEMATRQMYTGNPGQFLLWYYRRFASYRNVPPNEVHRWLAEECNSGRANLITQNIDGLDGRAGNRDYVCIHGRLDMMTAYDDQDALHTATTGVANIFTSNVKMPVTDMIKTFIKPIKKLAMTIFITATEKKHAAWEVCFLIIVKPMKK